VTDQTRTDIAEAIASLIGPADEEVVRLCVIGLGNVLYRHHLRGDDWTVLLSTHETEFGHAIDWIVSAVKDGDEWLARKDVDGRPMKLMKLHSVEQLQAEAEKSFRKKLQKLGKTVVLDEGERIEMELAEGYSVVRMLSTTSLDQESARMQHCIGLGSYDRFLGSNRRALFSLRDPFNKPHATMDIDLQTGIVLQIRGKQNAIPVERYLRRLGPFLQKFDPEEGELERLRIVIGSDGQLHRKIAIPDGTSFDGSLRLYSAPSTPRIPSSISVDGNLYVGPYYKTIFQVPASVAGDVSAIGLKIDGIAEDFVIGKNLNLEGCVISGFPGRHFRGDVNLKKTKGVHLMPGTVIDGSLDISHSDIRELPADIVIRGDLRATGSQLERLPPGTSIGGCLYLTDAKEIREIPPGIRIGRNLLLRGSSVRLIGDNVSVGGIISVGREEALGLQIAPDLRAGRGFYLRERDSTLKPNMSVEEFLEATEVSFPVSRPQTLRPR
jgi:hypothetical protein